MDASHLIFLVTFFLQSLPLTLQLLYIVGLDTPVDKDSGEKKGGVDEPSDMMSKDELLQGMEKVDREIAQVKQQINNLKKVQVSVMLFSTDGLCKFIYGTWRHGALLIEDR